MIESHYLYRVLNPISFNRLVDKVVELLTPHSEEFEAVAFRGMSGALIGGVIAARLGKNMLMVRKGEDTHSPYTCEGEKDSRKYIIIDDQCSSGKTVGKIREGVIGLCGEATCVGVLMYFQEIKSTSCYTREIWRRVQNDKVFIIAIPPYPEI